MPNPTPVPPVTAALTPEQRQLVQDCADLLHNQTGEAIEALLQSHDALAAENRALVAKVEEFFAANDALDAYHHTLRVPHPVIERLDAADRALRQSLTATRPPEAPRGWVSADIDPTPRYTSVEGTGAVLPTGEAPKGGPR